VTVDQESVGGLGPAVPPHRLDSGRGRPRTQVEPGSLGSGRPPSPLSEPAPAASAGGRSRPELTAAERAALQQLADASSSVVANWPVGRTIALALIRRGLVNGCSEWVWLTQAGRQALGATPAPQPIPATRDPHMDVVAERLARPPSPARRTERPSGRQPQATTHQFAVQPVVSFLEVPSCEHPCSWDPAAHDL
jgi:hypothetical protein